MMLLTLLLIMYEVRVGLDGGFHLGEIGSILQLHIYHAAVQARTDRDGDAESILHAVNGPDGHGMTHGAAGTEIGVGDTLRGEALKQGAHNGVTARIPSGRDDADRAIGLGQGAEGLFEASYNVCLSAVRTTAQSRPGTDS